MKRKFTLIALSLFGMGALKAQNLHMVNGYSSDYGYDYNESTGVISNLFFTFGEDDGYDITDEFVVSWGVQSDAQDSETYIEMDRVYFTQGIDAYSSFVINSWGSKDLNDNWDVEDGDYLIAGIVDTDDNIAEYDESAANNGMFLASNVNETISFTAGGSTNVASKTISEASVFPSPVEDIAQVRFNLAASSDVTINVYDLTGKLVSASNFQSRSAGEHIIQFSTESLLSGMYLTEISTGESVITERLVKK